MHISFLTFVNITISNCQQNTCRECFWRGSKTSNSK